MSLKMFENLWSDSIMYVGQSRRESACRKPSSLISIDYVSQPLPQHVCVCVATVCVSVCVCCGWGGWWLSGRGCGGRGAWNTKLCELSNTKITLLLTAAWRR